MKKICIALAVLLVAAIVFGGVQLGQNGSLRSELDSAKQQVQSVQDQLTQKAAELETKAGELTENTSLLDAAKAELDNVRAELEGKVSELEAKVTELTDDSTVLEAAKAELENVKTELEGKVAELEAKVTELTDGGAALEAAKAELEAKVAELTGSLETVTAKAEAAAAQASLFATDFTGKTVILHTNDVHGAIAGYAYLPALRKAIENAGGKVIIADAGDYSQGEIYVSVNKGAAAVTLMNAAGYDVVTLGNHEFDYGYAQLMENMKSAEFSVICSDVLLEDGSSIFPGHVIIESDGVKIGFFGLETPETATKVNPGLIKEISFATFDALYENAQAQVDALKEEGADLVIGLWHLGVDDESAVNGYRSIDVLAKVTGVDFVIDGHSHTVMTEAENGEPVQSTGTKFAYIGVVVIDNATKAIESHCLLSTNGLTADEATAAKAQEIIAEIDSVYNTPFATTAVAFNGDRAPGNRTEETNLGDLICDAMIWSVLDAGSLDEGELMNVVGITNGGGIRAPIAAGDITMKDVNTVLPFGNTVAVIRVTGAELLEALEASTFCTPDAIGGFPQTSGIVWTLDTTKPYDQGDIYTLNGKDTSYYAPKSIQRVTIESINGQPFDPEGTYVVVTNNFCAEGGDTYNVFNRAYAAGSGFDTAIPMDEALVSYIQNQLNSAIEADPEGGRLTIIQ